MSILRHIFCDRVLESSVSTIADFESRTYPAFALMRDPPPIDRKSRSVFFGPRPLEGHVSSAHYCLSDVVKAMVYMMHRRLDHGLINLCGIGRIQGNSSDVECLPYLLETMELMKHRHIVLFTLGALDARLKSEFS